MQPEGDARFGGEAVASVEEIFRRQKFEAPGPVDSTECVGQGDHPTLVLKKKGTWLTKMSLAV